MSGAATAGTGLDLAAAGLIGDDLVRIEGLLASNRGGSIGNVWGGAQPAVVAETGPSARSPHRTELG